MKTRPATTPIIPAIIIISLLALSGCGHHKMDSMHGMDMKNDKTTSMEKPMMEEDGKKMEPEAMTDEMEMKKSEGTM